MKKPVKQKKQNGKVLIDNYWIAESDAEKYSADRKEAAEKATEAMRSFCDVVKLQWAGSEDGEAVVGFSHDGNIRTLIHLDPPGVRLILSMNRQELIAHLQ